MWQIIPTGVILLSVFAISGCDQAPVVPTADVAHGLEDRPAVNDVSESSLPNPAASAAVSLEVKSWAEVQSWVSAQSGKVVVLDVWSTSCIPCLRELPHFVELHDRLQDQVACASLSVDYYGGAGKTPQDLVPRVQKFLADRHATTTNFLCSDQDESVLQQLNSVAIPVVVVYNQRGELVETFKNDELAYGEQGFTYQAHVTPLVEKLLSEGP